MNAWKKSLYLFGFFCIFFGVATDVHAADHYVRSDATGSANGNDWTNAYKSLPATLVRGDTYYIADGTYGEYTFDDPVSGTQLITIKKAIASDHGTDTGWSPDYGDETAVFTAPVAFSTAYWIFNGQMRNESDWFDGAAYGFKIANAAGDMDPTVYMHGSYVTVSYVWMLAQTIGTAGTRTYVMDYEGPTTNIGSVVSHSFTQNGSNHYFLRNVNGSTVEYCASSQARSNANNHGENVNLYGYFGQSDNVTVRHNIFKDNFNAPVGQYGTAVIATVGANGNQIYGNVFANNYVTDGVIGWAGTGPSGYGVTNMKIHNNTFVNNGGYNSGITLEDTSTGNTAYNNIFFGSYSFANITHSYNAFSGSAPSGETNAQINVSSSVFANYSGGNFRLSSATNAGTTLSSPYNMDMNGIIRGADGTWDRGAYEYVSGGSSDTTAPTLTQVTAIPSLTRDNTPNYAFSSNEAGTISYAGDCTSTNTSATASTNTITLNTIARGTHSNCSLKVTDAAGNQSVPLSIPSFTITYKSDLNLDRTVNMVDFGLVSTHYGTTNSAGDVNQDGTVNMLDFGVMRTEYGGSV